MEFTNTPLAGRFTPASVDRAVYLGPLTLATGAEQLIELGKLLRGSVRLELVGHADKLMRPMMMRAHDEGSVLWHGPLPRARQLELADGALTRLSSRRDTGFTLPFTDPSAAAEAILGLRRTRRRTA